MKNARPFKLFMLTLTSLVLVVASMFSITGCGFKEAAQEPPEPEPIINPLTGIEMDEELPTRPIIFSIDNVGDAIPQSNLSQADLIYEFPVEGLQTRLQAVFYSQFPEFVGPIRSVRPYFVDMVREYGAIYVAHGWSGAAKSYLRTRVVPYINAMEEGEKFYRVSDKEGPHDSYIAWDTLSKAIDNEGWWNEPNTVRGFKFAAVGTDPYGDIRREASDQLEGEANETDADAVNSDVNSEADQTATAEAAAEEAAEAEAVDGDPEAVEEKPIEVGSASKAGFHYFASGCDFVYNEETGKYDRFIFTGPYIDKETGEQIAVDNVLVQTVSSSVLDEKGRLEIDMCAGGEAYLFTQGNVIKGTWSRAGLEAKTKFYDENGHHFQLTPGTTWIEIMDQNCSYSYE